MTWDRDKVKSRWQKEPKWIWAAPKSGHQMGLGRVSGSLQAFHWGDVHDAKADDWHPKRGSMVAWGACFGTLVADRSIFQASATVR